MRQLVCAVALAFVHIAPGTVAHARSCANPDRLCRGNPCVIRITRVDSPCILDFGMRDVEIRHTLRVPDGGVFSLKAGSISAQSIVGAGAAVMLSAERDIILGTETTDVSGNGSGGSIDLKAGTSVTLGAPLRAAGSAGFPFRGSRGGTITIDAGDQVRGRGDLDTRGSSAPAGPISITAGTGVLLAGIRAVGTAGGDVTVAASAGDVVFRGGIDASGSVAPGGRVEIHAASVQVGRDIRARGSDGGSVRIEVATGGFEQLGSRGIDVSGDDRLGVGGTVVLQAPSIPTMPSIQATGHTGGAVRVEATAGAIGGYDIDVSGSVSHGTGGKVCLTAPSISLGDGIDARGSDHGGAIVVEATAGNLSLTAGDFDASGASRPHTGGIFQATASGDLHLDFASIDVHRDGCIGLTGRNVFTPLVRFSDPIQPTCGVMCLP